MRVGGVLDYTNAVTAVKDSVFERQIIDAGLNEMDILAVFQCRTGGISCIAKIHADDFTVFAGSHLQKSSRAASYIQDPLPFHPITGPGCFRIESFCGQAGPID